MKDRDDWSYRPRSSETTPRSLPEGAGRAGRGDHVRHPVTRREERVGPLHHRHPGTGPPGHRGLRLRQPSPRPGDHRLGCQSPPDRNDGVEHLGQCARVDGQDLPGATQVAERVIDGTDIDRAHCTQSLGDHQVGIRIRQRALVQMVKILPGCHPGPDLGVDLAWGHALGQHRCRHDPRDRASGGKSHSKVTPTTSSPAPIAKRISVVDGSSDTIRTAPQPSGARVRRLRLHAGQVDAGIGQSDGVDRPLGGHERGDGIGHIPYVDVHAGHRDSGA